MQSGNPLDWPGYPDPRTGAGGRDSIITGRAVIDPSRTDSRYVVIAGRFDCMAGSMGAAHGEKVVRAYRRATIEKLPVVVIAATEGTRLEEGVVALAQLARTTDAARSHSRAGLLSLAIMRNPTSGGVLASYGSTTHIRAAEPGAVLSAPSTAEDAFSAGRVDALIARSQEAAWIELALGLRDCRLAAPGPQEARAADRPTGIDHAARLCDSWVELRGSDPTVRAGLVRIGRHRAVVVANDRRAGSGYVSSGGLRLAQRAAHLAGGLGVGLITLVDTPGATDDDTIAEEISRTFVAITGAPVCTIAVCVGVGGGDAAMALATCDRLIMLDHAVLSSVSLDTDVSALEPRLRLTAADVLALGLADEVVDEDDPAHLDEAILGALTDAVKGDRIARLDRATRRWLR